jgi:type I restriction enzyme S subunit
VLADVQPGFASGKHNSEGEGIPHLRPMNVSPRGTIDLSDVRFVAGDDPRRLKKGDILFNNTNSPAWVGKTALVDSAQELAFSNHMTRLRTADEVDSAFLAKQLHFLCTAGYFQHQCKKHVNQASISTSFLTESVPIVVPPVEQQQRIAAKIDELQTRSRTAREAMEAVPPLLEKFRQSVLAAAFRGDLTADWRAHNPDVGPASVLLERIRAERRRQWKATALEKMQAKGGLPRNDRWKASYEEPDLNETSGLPHLPDGWAWVPLSLLGQNALSPVQTGPFGAQLHSSEFVEEGIPVIAVGNLTGIGFSSEKLYFITDKKAAQLARYDVNAGDLLFARSGATLGKVCVAPEYIRDWRMTGHILRVRLNPDFALPHIVAFALWGAPVVKDQVTSLIRGMTRPGYNTSLLESIIVPVPPMEEQKTLLSKVAEALNRCDLVASVISEAQGRLRHGDQAILAKAFRGELVPQDPNDEPASVLLERIRQAREELPMQRRKRARLRS